MDPQAGLRKAFRLMHKRQRAAINELLESGVERHELALYWPHEDWGAFTALRCGAKTRAGAPCKQRALYECGRCRLHGGLSTGPKTAEGRARAAMNGHSPKRTP
jgi:hypothetical protein